ncbi:MAG: HNH endonuclease [Dethiobacter sp.]|jgi:hypothetical protein|nr:MAG: HNH endonuclease [Dethiobacter sp.]
MAPTAQDFQSALEEAFKSAQNQGEAYIDIKSGDLHKRVGEYPGSNHRMPVCCDIMKRNMKTADQILQQPPKGQGASLVIRYKCHHYRVIFRFCKLVV